MEIEALVSLATTGLEASGVAVLVVGAVSALGRALLGGRRGAGGGAYRAFREHFARVILVALELLVAADIVRTVAGRPTLADVLALGLIVLIRTFLGLMLQLEIEGRFPWQRPVALPDGGS